MKNSISTSDEILQEVSEINRHFKIFGHMFNNPRISKTGGKNHQNFQKLFLKIPE